MVAGSVGFRGGDAGLTSGSLVDSHEIRGLCFLYAFRSRFSTYPCEPIPQTGLPASCFGLYFIQEK